MNNEMILSVVRVALQWALLIYGTKSAVGKTLAESIDVNVVAPIIVALGVAIYSAIWKKRHSALIETAAALPEVAAVVTTAEVAGATKTVNIVDSAEAAKGIGA